MTPLGAPPWPWLVAGPAATCGDMYCPCNRAHYGDMGPSPDGREYIVIDVGEVVPDAIRKAINAKAGTAKRTAEGWVWEPGPGGTDTELWWDPCTGGAL